MRLNPMIGLSLAVILAGGCGGDGGTSLPANAAPMARFTAACAELTCTFHNASTDPDGNIESHEWTFGDDGSSNIAEPTHVYARGGRYTVILTTTDQAGAENSVSEEISVPPPAGLVCGSLVSPCTLDMREISQISVTVISRDCTAKQVSLTLTITELYPPGVLETTEPVFTDGCNPGPVGNPILFAGGQFFKRNSIIAAEVTSESDDPTRIGHALKASGEFPNWTLNYEDGEHHGSAGEPDYSDLVMTIVAIPWPVGGLMGMLPR